MYKIAIPARFNDNKKTFFVYQSYYQFLSSDFLITLVLPRHTRDYYDIVKENDALLIVGGDDIDPLYYQEELCYLTHLENKDIEIMDFDLISQFHQQHKAIIGICRGIQVLNVFFKGKLYQDIETQFPTLIHHRHTHHLVQTSHSLATYFPKTLNVNSFHHQAIQKKPTAFLINALSEDGLIEGIEYQNILGVQWHPERMDTHHQEQFRQLIKDFIEKDKTF